MSNDYTDYDAGLLNDFGGGNVDWWMDYIRAEIGRANDHWRQQVESAAAPEPMVPLRPQVATFAAAMEATLKANDHKGGWESVSTGWLWNRLMDEARELQSEVAHMDDDGMMREAVDVANFAMMIYDRAAIRKVRSSS